MFVDSLAPFLADFGETAVWSGANGASASALVIFDQPDHDVLQKRAQSRGYSITFAAASFPGIAFQDTLVLRGDTYSVIEVNSMDDGSFYTAQLERQ